MKKSILNLGKALNKAEQKQINGGGFCDGPGCVWYSNCNMCLCGWHLPPCES